MNIFFKDIQNAQNDPQWQYEQYRLGWDRFTAKEAPSACQNAEQLRGYMGALAATNNTDTSIYLQGSR